MVSLKGRDRVRPCMIIPHNFMPKGDPPEDRVKQHLQGGPRGRVTVKTGEARPAPAHLQQPPRPHNQVALRARRVAEAGGINDHIQGRLLLGNRAVPGSPSSEHGPTPCQHPQDQVPPMTSSALRHFCTGGLDIVASAVLAGRDEVPGRVLKPRSFLGANYEVGVAPKSLWAY